MSVSPLALVSPKARLGDDVTVGPFTVIHDNVFIGDRVTIEGHCELGHPTPLAEGEPLIIGDDSLIRSHSIFYEGSTFGPRLTTGHRATVREMFVAGPGLQIGTACDFQGHASVGDYVRTHSNVHIAQLSRIGNYVWLYPGVILTNDPHPPSDGFLAGVVIEDYAVIATMSTVMPGVRIGARSLVGAMSLVSHDVEPDTVVSGVPAQKRAMARQILLRDGSGQSAYPWMRHFRRGYPDEVVARWREEFGDLADD
jgi:acyl-[acyl carrier protein]--UDP-N-acetylglucosamine O-acyltransferase